MNMVMIQTVGAIVLIVLAILGVAVVLERLSAWPERRQELAAVKRAEQVAQIHQDMLDQSYEVTERAVGRMVLETLRRDGEW